MESTKRKIKITKEKNMKFKKDIPARMKFVTNQTVDLKFTLGMKFVEFRKLLLIISSLLQLIYFPFPHSFPNISI